MKKLCLTILLSCLCCFGVFAHSMTSSELAVGGVTLGSTLGYVKSVYGEPSQVETSSNPMGSSRMYRAVYVYGPLLTISGRTLGDGTENENEYAVYEVALRANNLSTPSGIMVGMPYSKVVALFGQGKYYYDNSKGLGGYVYQMPHSLKEMILYLDGNKNIAEIYLGEDF
jgi:hypothetical protein